MSDSRFVSRFQHRAFRHLPRPVRSPGLETRLDLRPARFVLGLEEPVHWTRLEEAESAPVSGAFYLGRVEDVTGDEVLATLWERPSGREASTTLSVATDLSGTSPPLGSMLRIWTWMELPGGGQEVARLKVEVTAPRPSEVEREVLLELAKSLEQQLEQQEEPEVREVLEKTDEA